MTLTALQALGWSTVTGAVLSAFLLASREPEQLQPLRRDDAFRQAALAKGPGSAPRKVAAAPAEVIATQTRTR
jgi:hypothetical protein